MALKRKFRASESSKKQNSTDSAAAQKPCSAGRAFSVTLTLALLGSLVVILYVMDLSAYQSYVRFTSLMKEPLIGLSCSPSTADRDAYYSVLDKCESSSSSIFPSVRNTTEWVQFPVISNETELRIRQIEANGTSACHEVRTHTGHVKGLPMPGEDGKPTRLFAGPIYEFSIISVGEDGSRRCAGGDFYETDLSGTSWKSRPPVVDNGDGSYRAQMQVDPRFAGLYTLKITLLYANFHGLHLLVVDDQSPWIRRDQVYVGNIEFVVQPPPPPSPPLTPPDEPLQLRRCGIDDYNLNQWSGRWTRTQFSSSCEINSEGRFICLPHETPCDMPWCQGPLGVLESNGWVYSAHCSFKLFSEDEAWQCLDGKWLYWWGDSNHLDTARNLLSFVLGLDMGTNRLERRTDKEYIRPSSSSNAFDLNKRPQQSVRMTNIFNGHADLLRNYQGLFSLTNTGFRTLLSSYFGKDKSPDVMIMNSGLHDGCYWANATAFVQQGLDLASKFWRSVLDSILPKTPRFIYRTTIAVGGNSRARGFNPHKMELFNKFMVEKLQNANVANMRIVDGYDLTFPWHYDNEANDGAHYGKAPSRTPWVNGKIGHQYFVDLMLVHILLNAICDDH